MNEFYSRQRWLRLLLFASFLAFASAAKVVSKQVGQMSLLEVEEALQQCPLVQELNIHKRSIVPETAGYAKLIFEKLFPYGPAVNALLATLYISGPPNFLLALCPPSIDPSSLTIMVAFAVGGLLGDTLFHLLPEIFLGEAAQDHERFIMVDTNKNILLGVAILVGFVTFVAMDKTLRIATGAGHSHGSEPPEMKDISEDRIVKRAETPSGASTSVQNLTPNGSIKSRKEKSLSGPPSIFSDSNALTMPAGQLRRLRDLDETKRANRWLESVLEEDPTSGVTQIAIWKAYEAAFKDATYPLLEATILIHGASRVFANASAQIIEEPDKKFIIKGVKPRERKEREPKSDSSADKALTKDESSTTGASKPEVSQSIKLSAYLNLIADFTHNITDGLALSSSFYASPTLGATTCVAVFFHEIPHEVGDFALLIQSGFSKRAAMGAQFITALGAFLGTCIGIAVQEYGKSEKGNQTAGGLPNSSGAKGLAGTGLGWEDMLLPFTAGTFLYVGTVAVIPELLEVTEKSGKGEVKKTIGQFLAMALGAGIMLGISWA